VQAVYVFSRPVAFATNPKLEPRQAVVQACSSSPLTLRLRSPFVSAHPSSPLTLRLRSGWREILHAERRRGIMTWLFALAQSLPWKF